MIILTSFYFIEVLKTLKLSFLCEFGLPTPNKPVPIATVKTFFSLEPDNTKNVSIKYRFENDSLIHIVDKTVHPLLMEV